MVGLRNLRRLRQIVGVLFRYEFYHLIDMLDLKHHLLFHRRFEPKDGPLHAPPEKIREMFEHLGGGFIKLGQILALRPDLIGEKYSTEFEKLLTDVSPEDPKIIKDLVKGIGLTNFDPKPLGSASIAQVHKATLKGKTVAVKIKRPGIDEIFDQDIEIMEYLAKKIKEKYKPTFLDPVDIVNEFKVYTKKELDLEHEAINLKRFYDNFKKNKDIVIPKVYEQSSSSTVLVMEYLEGKNILSAKTKNKGVIKKVSDAVHKMLFEDRFFHADLHPGNIYINKGKIIFLDFGIVGHIDRQLEKKLFYLFSSLVTGNIEKTADSLLELNIGNEEPDEIYLREGIFTVLGDYYNVPLSKMNFPKMFYGAIEVAKKSHIKLPASMVLFGKSLVTLEGFCRQIDPKFNAVSNAKPYVQKKLAKELKPGKIIKGAKDTTMQLYEVLVSVPTSVKHLSRLLHRFEHRVADIDNTFQLLSRMVWRVSMLITLTLLFVTFFISSVILMDKIPLYYDLSLYSWIGFGISALLLIEIARLYGKKV